MPPGKNWVSSAWSSLSNSATVQPSRTSPVVASTRSRGTSRPSPCHEAFHARSHGGQDHVEAAEDVALRVEDRVARGLANVHLRGVMVNNFGFDLVEDPVHAGGIADVHLVEARLGVEVVMEAGAQIVEHGDLVALLEVFVSNV